MDGEHEPASTPPAAPSTAQPSSADAEPVARPSPQALPERRIGAAFYTKLGAFLFVVAYAIAFIVGNDKSISVDFVFATARVSLIWTILLLLGVGLAGGALLSQLYRHRRGEQSRKP
jgi:uncharacterized integral membrane protein